MEGTGTSATAMLVATPSDVGGRPDAATVTLAREEIEEALASDEPLDLILTVDRGTGPPQDVRVSWERSGPRDGARGHRHRWDHVLVRPRGALPGARAPGLRGHGIREMVLITVAAASASAALAASTASAQLMEPGRQVAAGRLRSPPFRRRRPAGPGDPRDDPVPEPRGGRRPEPVPGRRVDGRRRPTWETIPYLEPGDRRRPKPVPGRRVDRRARRPSPERSRTSARGSASTRANSRATRSRRSTTRRRSSHVESTRRSRRRRGIGHGEAATASELAAVAGIHDETSLAARGVDQIVPGADEADARGPGDRDTCGARRGTLVTRGIESQPVLSSTPAPASSCRASTPARPPRSAGSPVRGSPSSAHSWPGGATTPAA